MVPFHTLASLSDLGHLASGEFKVQWITLFLTTTSEVSFRRFTANTIPFRFVCKQGYMQLTSLPYMEAYISSKSQ